MILPCIRKNTVCRSVEMLVLGSLPRDLNLRVNKLVIFVFYFRVYID